MSLLQETWFWVWIIAAPIITVIGMLARLARREPPPRLPPTTKLSPTEEDD